MGRRPARCYRYCKNKPYVSDRWNREHQVFSQLYVPSLSLSVFLAKISVLPWCTRCEDPYLRFGPQESPCRRISSLCSPCFRWIRTTVQWSTRSRTYLCQQIPRQALWQRCISYSYACSPVSRHANQQNVVLRRCRSSANRYAWCLR